MFVSLEDRYVTRVAMCPSEPGSVLRRADGQVATTSDECIAACIAAGDSVSVTSSHCTPWSRWWSHCCCAVVIWRPLLHIYNNMCLDSFFQCYAARFIQALDQSARCWSYTDTACQPLTSTIACTYYLRVGCREYLSILHTIIYDLPGSSRDRE